MNNGNNFPPKEPDLSVRKHLLNLHDPSGHSQYPITIAPSVDAAFNARSHCHRLTELMVNFRGTSGTVVTEGCGNIRHHLPIGEQQCCLMPAGICHRLVVENPERHVSLFVDESVISTSPGECVPGPVVDDLRRLAWGDPFMSQLIAELDNPKTTYSESVLTHSMLTALAVKIIDGFLRIYKETGQGAKIGLSESEQKRALAFIESNLESKFCVGLLAKHMAMSLPHFNRRFRAAFGMPPLQYALRLRVDKALDLLRGGDARVADAAFAAGFCDQSHFDRHCRKFYGFPPGALIRAAR